MQKDITMQQHQSLIAHTTMAGVRYFVCFFESLLTSPICFYICTGIHVYCFFCRSSPLRSTLTSSLPALAAMVLIAVFVFHALSINFFC
ncbi:hypothetical protein T492DRAFT_927843 [Pavlovales sp. CCMP2436]|nr:hypothetical protein T492DRAFT_927843 [Pavlovales sp. CCMP2436]